MCSQSAVNLPVPPLTLSPFPATHQILPTHRGINGDFTHWRPALAPRPPAHPALSSATDRAFGDSKNFVRGKGSYAPFLPGGLEATAIVDEPEEEEEEEDGWKTRAPGLRRGVKLEGAEEFLTRMLGQEGLGTRAKRRKRDGFEDGELEVSKLDHEEKEAWRGGKGVDDLLPIGVSLRPMVADAASPRSSYRS